MIKEITIPDIGTESEVTVIEITVNPGDLIKTEQSLITLESEKASMEIPSPEEGHIESLLIKIGDKVKTGTPIMTVRTHQNERPSEATLPDKDPHPEKNTPENTKDTKDAPLSAQPSETLKTSLAPSSEKGAVYASPGVRRLAGELGIALETLTGTGKKNRIQKSDLIQSIKQTFQSGAASLPPAPVIDFNQWGPTETRPLTKIKKLTGVYLQRSWAQVPQVTQFDEADITDLERFRKAQAEQGLKLTPLVFVMKAVAQSLKKQPDINASLDASGNQLILKQYVHLGIAVDTPEGLVVPVIFDVDKKSLTELATELAHVSQKARKKQLMPKDMQGSCFTLSSLGGIGGTAFTPLVNAPDPAILGISKASVKPVYQDGHFVPRLMLPLALSYDHRIIDGAQAARFIVQVSQYLSNISLLLL